VSAKSIFISKKGKYLYLYLQKEKDMFH